MASESESNNENNQCEEYQSMSANLIVMTCEKY